MLRATTDEGLSLPGGNGDREQSAPHASRLVTLASIGRRFLPLLFLAVAIATLWVLDTRLREFHYHEIVAALASMPLSAILASLAFTAASYAVLTVYDLLAVRYAGSDLTYRRVALVSFIGYAVNNIVGLSGVAGSSIRYRLYSGWGLSTIQVAKVIAFTAATFWLGLMTLSGSVFVAEPIALPAALHLPFDTTLILGLLLLVVPCAWISLSLLRREPFRVGAWELALPAPSIAFAQLAVSSVDWFLAPCALYALLPASEHVSLPRFLAIYLLAQTAGVISNLPGGIGVFEAIVLVMLTPAMNGGAVAATLVAYRVIYYLIPLLVALVALGGFELARHRQNVAIAAKTFFGVVGSIVPQLFSVTTFVAGVILLASGATPAVHTRVSWLRDVIPLPLLEISHLLGSVAGAALLLLARGIQRRLNAAWTVTMAILLAGGVVSLAKGLDYEEAAILFLMAILLATAREEFYRKTSLLNEPFSRGWIAAIAVALVATFWLGVFSYKHVAYSSDLWWHFSFAGNAPRFLRASVAAACVVLLFSLRRLLMPARSPQARPCGEELEKARAIVAASPVTTASLALLGDKTLMFSESGDAMLMYAIEGRSWIAMGDPVGPERERSELAWRFRERCDEHDGWPVFYEVSRESLPLCIDLGLTLMKIGEEARVPLGKFSIDEASRGLRRTWKKLDSEGVAVEIAPPEEVVRLMPELRAISDEWLGGKNTREKRFSLGFFDERYLSGQHVAVVSSGGEPVAFANLWLGAGKHEASVDLMRHRDRAPQGVMDFLFLSLMKWCHDEGYEWFNLGMAPLAGLEGRELAPAWHRVGTLAYRHGEYFYNFQGLRAYKEKFDPVWEPMYLATPRGFALPVILTNLAVLISGGLKGALAR